MLFSPLEQFEVKLLSSLSFLNMFDISITSITFYTVLASFIVYTFFYFSVYKATIVPTSLLSVAELFYSFIFGMIRGQSGLGGSQYLPLYFTTFFFILGFNLIGLMPFATTVTAQIVNTFVLAFGFNIGFIVIGFMKHQLGFLKLFVPQGAPAALVPLIVVIEVISYLMRTLSLSLRLFANMFSGHVLLHILASFSVKFAEAGLYIMVGFPFILILMITVLEFGIAFLQAYVFVVLLCIYLNDSLHPGH